MTRTVIGIDPHKNSHTASALSATRDDLGIPLDRGGINYKEMPCQRSEGTTTRISRMGR